MPSDFGFDCPGEGQSAQAVHELVFEPFLNGVELFRGLCLVLLLLHGLCEYSEVGSVLLVESQEHQEHFLLLIPHQLGNLFGADAL